jgi:hypothetical protein
MLMVVNHRYDVVLLIYAQGIIQVLFDLLHVPNDYGLVLRCRCHQGTRHVLSNSAHPLAMLGEGLQQVTIMSIPNSYSVVP